MTEAVRLRRGAVRVEERVERAERREEGSRDEVVLVAAERRMARIIVRGGLWGRGTGWGGGGGLREGRGGGEQMRLEGGGGKGAGPRQGYGGGGRGCGDGGVGAETVGRGGGEWELFLSKCGGEGCVARCECIFRRVRGI